MKKSYILNAFSLQMIEEPCIAIFEAINSLPKGLTSAIGHADTANVLGVPMNRINVHLSEGDVAYVAQLQGGRLPEGSKSLPEGFMPLRMPSTALMHKGAMIRVTLTISILKAS